MVIEALSRVIRKSENIFLRGIQVGLDGFSITHLQFVDDTIIFCDATYSQIGYLRSLLRCFKVVSRLKMNLAKSEIFGVRNIQKLNSFAAILGCEIGKLPLSYVEFPLESIVQN